MFYFHTQQQHIIKLTNILKNDSNDITFISTIKMDDSDAVTFLTPRGYELLKEAMDNDDIKSTKKDLTVSPNAPPTNPVPPKEFPIYRETKSRLIVPRHYGFEQFGNPDVSTLHTGTLIKIPFNGTLRDYQYEIIDTYLNYVNDKKNHGGHEGGGGLISVGCGQGKTVMALNIISRISRKTLVIVHKEFLMNQWIERIQQFLPTARVGKIQGKIIDTQHKDIVIGMLQSISMKDYESSLFQQFGLTIIDECFPADTNIVTSNGVQTIEDLFVEWVEYTHCSKNSKDYQLPNILSYNRITDQYEWKPLTQAWIRTKPCMVRVYYGVVNDEHNIIHSFDCTPNHQILVNYGSILQEDDYELRSRHASYLSPHSHEDKLASTVYIRADELHTGDCIVGCRVTRYKEGTIVESEDVQEYYIVKQVEYLMDDAYTVYDIEVAENHNFVILPRQESTESMTYHGLVVSNCHHIGAEVFSRSLFKMVTPYMLGLSATLTRKDGLTNVFKMFLGDVVYEMKRKVDPNQKEDDRVLIRAIQYQTKNEAFNRTELNFKGQMNYAVMIRKLCEYTQRTEFILDVIYDLLKENEHHQIMVLAHNKSILKYIYQAVEKREWASVGYYLGGMKETALKESESKRVVIATYAMAEEALDIKTLTTLVMVTPKTDVEQAVGRILRSKHENARPIVVDITDTHDVFKNQWKKRQTFYRKNGYEILTTSSVLYQDARRKVYSTNQASKHLKPPFHKHPDTEIQRIWTSPTTRKTQSRLTASKATKQHKQHKQTTQTKLPTILCGVDVDALRGGFEESTMEEQRKSRGCLISVSTEELDICMNAYKFW